MINLLMGASLLALAKSIYYTRNCMTVKSVTYVSNVIGMSFGTLCNKITRETKFISANIALSTTIDVFVFRSRTSLTFVHEHLQTKPLYKSLTKIQETVLSAQLFWAQTQGFEAVQYTCSSYCIKSDTSRQRLEFLN